MKSTDFYHLYKAGELEQSRDFIQWVGYYEAKLERDARYREQMYAHNRITAPGISFEQPNVPFLIAEIERDFL